MYKARVEQDDCALQEEEGELRDSGEEVEVVESKEAEVASAKEDLYANLEAMKESMHATTQKLSY